MYDIAKKAREAMKSKAKRLASPSKEKVSSSDWTPPEELNADVKTGMRPISRRAYKSGGKVAGECSAAADCYDWLDERSWGSSGNCQEVFVPR